MVSAETQALEKATREDGSLDLATYQAEYKRGLAERQRQQVRDAQAILRAVDGWTSVESPEDWERIVRQADEDLQTGAFMIERLGGQRYLDPSLVAALYVLRRQLIDEQGATTAAEFLMIETTLVAFYHQLRINRWIGDLAASVETELFGGASLGVRLDQRRGRGTTVRGLTVEELIQRMSEQLMPLLDRSKRMMLRNLKALREHRRLPGPNISINRAEQVNVGSQQLNISAQTGTLLNPGGEIN